MWALMKWLGCARSKGSSVRIESERGCAGAALDTLLAADMEDAGETAFGVVGGRLDASKVSVGGSTIWAVELK